MKKFLSVALSFALTLGACFGFAACGDEEGGSGGSTGGGGSSGEPEKPAHVHTYEEGWTCDNVNHWHRANCEHTDLTSDPAPHDWREEYEAQKFGHFRVCTTCNYEERIVDHKFGDTYIPSEDGHYRVCSVCNYQEEKKDHIYEKGICKTCGFELTETKSLSYSLVEGGYAVKGFKRGSNGEAAVIVPATFLGKPVVAVADSAFKSNEVITYVKLPDSVTSIGSSAFNGCKNLAEVKLGQGVQSIGDYAFASTVITEIDLPDTLLSIGNSAFYYTDLLSVTIPKSVEQFGRNIFNWCWQLKTATFGDGIAEIPEGMFADCAKLTTVNFPSSMVSVGSRAFKNAAAFDCDVSRFTTINSFAFQGSGVTNAVIHAATVENDAFRDCKKLTSLELGDEVTELNYNAFTDCTALKTVKIGSGLKTIKGGAGSQHSGVFDGCTARTTLTVSADNAYYRSENNAILSKDGTRLVLANVQGEFPSGVTAIGDSAFYGNDTFVNLVIPDTITSIGKCSFGGHSKLKTVRLPSALTSMGLYNFMSCPILETFTVPSGVKVLGINMFNECPKLTAVVFEGTADWYVVENKVSNPKKIAVDVTDSAKNVEYFTTYKDYKWQHGA